MADLKLYGEPGWGSAIVETQLVWCDIPYDFCAVGDLFKDAPARESAQTQDRQSARGGLFDCRHSPTEARAALEKINPLAQIPTLVLPNGDILTESAAITLWLADLTCSNDLVPELDESERTRFLRWLVFIVANIYPTYTYVDDPARFVPDEAARAGYADTVYAYAKKLYGVFETEASAPWFLGERFSALDLYIGVMSHWTPRRKWFEENAPKFTAIADRALALPKLAEVWARNFPKG